MTAVLFFLLCSLLTSHTVSFKITRDVISFAGSRHIHRMIPKMAAKESPWDFADGVYLITTTQQENSRLERTRVELDKVSLWDRVKVRTFKPDDEDRVRGCYSSHISVLREIQKEFKGRKNYQALVLEDNLETTLRMDPSVVKSVEAFLEDQQYWDVFHLAYMMYVPGLSLNKMTGADIQAKSWSQNVVQMKAGPGSSVGTSAYIISKTGVEAILAEDSKSGYKEAIPNVMAILFPESRFAAYPMIFHRAAKVSSLVNPQLDDFRKIMFSPLIYTTWEQLMVSSGLQTNQLFPGISFTLLISIVSAIYVAVMGGGNGETATSALLGPLQAFAAAPLAVAIWGATLFKPGNKGAGFAPSAQKNSKK